MGPASYAKLDPLTVGMSPPDSTIALLSGSGDVTACSACRRSSCSNSRQAVIHTVLNSYDVMDGPHTMTVAWTSSQFRDKNPALYKALLAAFTEATEMLDANLKEAAQLWIDDVKSKLPVDKVAAIAAGTQVRWTMAPESTLKYAEFMHSVGTIKAKPADWKELFFPEIHALPGS